MYVIHYTVLTCQSEVTVLQSDDGQSRQDDESSQAEHTNGLYLCKVVKVLMYIAMYGELWSNFHEMTLSDKHKANLSTHDACL